MGLFNRIKSKAIISAAILTVSLCGCGKKDITETADPRDNYIKNIDAEEGFEEFVDEDYFMENFSKITYDGITFQLPMLLSEFKELGIEISDLDVDTLAPGESDYTFILRNGNSTSNSINIVNYSEEEAKPDDCYVYSFRYFPLDSPDAQFYAGITRDTEEEYVRNFMGADGDNYSIYCNFYDEDYIEVDFNDSEIQSVTVHTNPDYIKDNSTVIRSANKEGNISDDFREHYNEVTIEGKTLKFPISTKEFTDAGFEIQSMYRDMIYSKGERVSGTARYGEESTNFFAIYASQNISDDSVHVDDGDIISFTWDRAATDITDISFYGGIAPDSTRDEVKAILEESVADADGALYKAYLDEDEHQGMEVLFIGDELVTVSLYTDYEE